MLSSAQRDYVEAQIADLMKAQRRSQKLTPWLFVLCAAMAALSVWASDAWKPFPVFVAVLAGFTSLGEVVMYGLRSTNLMRLGSLLITGRHTT